MLWKIFGPERKEIIETGGQCTVRSFITCIPNQILLWLLHLAGQDEWGIWHACERQEIHTGFDDKPDGKRPFWTHSHWEEDHITIGAKETG
jgi:hypothetical protein